MGAEAYLPYHRRFRPKTLMEYIGNEKMKKSMMASLQGVSRPQVLLFQGHAGCGKTTAARLAAKEYLCENRDIVTGACGNCYHCQILEDYIETGDSGNLMNVREIDVTDSNKKQDIDELLDDASTPSYDGNWKIFILDECHMMTNAAQNRLLKNLEEPAEQVLMILCTTDPEKLLATIISRCQYIFKVTKPSRDELANLLARVLRIEGVPFEEKALSQVCVKGEFVPRKTLVALEQVVREKQSVTQANVQEVLNLVADKYFFEFYNLLLKDPINIFKYIKFLGEIKSQMDMKQFIESLLDFTKRGIYIMNGIEVEALDKDEIKQYRDIFGSFAVGDIAFLLDLLLNMKVTADIESRLMLLGYTGLKRNTKVNTPTEAPLVDVTTLSSQSEKKEGDASYLESITMSDQEKEAFVTQHKQTVTAEDLANRFKGVKVTLTPPTK